MARNMAAGDSSWTEDTERRTKRKIGWLPLPTKPKLDFSVHQGQIWGPLQGLRIRKSIWLWIAIGLLLLSNILFAVAFLTNNWGVLLVGVNKPAVNSDTTTNNDKRNSSVRDTFSAQQREADFREEQDNSTTWSEYFFGKPIITQDHTLVFSSEGIAKNQTLAKGSSEEAGLYLENERYWEFGLWECCRNDGFCLGTRWPAFYSACRAFSVMGLFGHILTLAWMSGHALENLLEYDVCSMVALIVLNIVTAVFLLIAVCAFGTRWPVEFRNDFHGTDTYLSYSYYLALVSFLLVSAAAGFAIADLVLTWRKLRTSSRQDWATADDILGEEEEDDDEDEIEGKSWSPVTHI